ncbi:MAG: substrate-binding domain-containing protein [Verrucomicrobia bacterium]|nr:substrate-binding domain-containing protein [Verrucomicrobiota bacterium]
MNSTIENEAGLPRLDFRSGEPLLIQIARYYRRQIREGTIPRGSQLPTCLRLGRSLGLAAQTVNRAFDLLAQEGLVHRRRSLGTIVGPPGKGWMSDSTAASHRPRPAEPPICMVVRRMEAAPEEPNLLFTDYLNGLMEGFNAWKHRFEIAYLQPDQPDVDLVKTLVETGQSRGFINLLLAPDATEYLIRKGVPMVMLGEDLSARGVASVTADHVQGYREAWGCARELGHWRIAFFGLDDNNFAQRLRECVAGGALTPPGCKPRQTVRAPARSQAGGPNQADPDLIWQTLVRALGPWRGKRNWPTLFFAQNDLIASRLIRAVQEHGVHVPRDVSVIGFDDSAISRHFHPSIATLAKPRFKMGLAAAQLLLDILGRRPGSRGRLQVFPVRLMERESLSARSGKP